MRTFKILTPLICVLAVFGAAPKAAKGDEVIEGPATVIDGQTLTVAGRTMRLHGLMAPPKDLICHTKHDKPYKCGFCIQAFSVKANLNQHVHRMHPNSSKPFLITKLPNSILGKRSYPEHAN